MFRTRSMSSWLIGAPWLAAPVLAAGLFLSSGAQALPNFARQTGQPCSACHVGAFGPQLTPFGRTFKLEGYTAQGGDGPNIPLSGMLLGSFNTTGQSQGAPAAQNYGANNNVAMDQISAFLGGRVDDHVGGMMQVTFNGISSTFKLDNTDIRLTTNFNVGQGSDLRVGVSLNNGPTVQDPYNTSFAWGFPYVFSSLVPTPAAQPLLAGGLIGNSYGITAYARYDSGLYLEAGGYQTFNSRALSWVGTTYGPGATRGVAPYLRAAYEWNWNGQSAWVGGMFLSSNFNPANGDRGSISDFGRDHYSDFAVDAGYQFLGEGKHVATVNGIYTHEDQALNGTAGNGGAGFANHRLDQVRASASYYYDQTYGLTLGWQRTWGTADPVLYAPGPLSGSANGKPDSNSFTVEADWVPFGKADSWMAPLANLKLGVQYTIYTQFNGGTSNYDGNGRNASGNNTLYVFAWTLF